MSRTDTVGRLSAIANEQLNATMAGVENGSITIGVARKRNRSVGRIIKALVTHIHDIKAKEGRKS